MYIKELKNHIEKIIHKQNPKSFDELFKFSKGAFPDLVYSLASNNDFLNTLKRKFYGLKSVNNIIPESNPTNYDWRFDNQTTKKIVGLIKDKKFKRIALFGTPSLFIPISKYFKDVTLYDINEPLKEHFNNDKRLILTDLNSYKFSNNVFFDCIIMDPPWYLDYYKIWLQKGNSILNMNGEIYITLFQELLRPKAIKELKIIENIAHKIGTYKIIENYINYITPLFETELFNYKNIPCYSNWRTADLLLIKKTKNIPFPEIKKYKRDTWVRLEIGTQTVAIDVSKNAKKDIKVIFPYKNNDSLIKTVSDRDQIRKKINFMTSRNRGLIITGGDRVTTLLKAISNGVPGIPHSYSPLMIALYSPLILGHHF